MAGGWRRGALIAAGSALLAGPTALAFFSGGYFEGPRVWAGAGAWACVVVALVAGAPLPRGREALLAIGGLGLLAGWTLLSILWAPIAGDAYAAAQIAMLYLGALIAAALLLGDRTLSRGVEPVLAAGTVIVICYGISERLLPGVLHFARSVSAQGRLEQPLTYWNAMGAVAAIGLVLCGALAGSADRPPVLRSLAAAAAAPMGLGLYISFSRGALFACVAGLVALIVAAPRREQLIGGGVVVLAAALAAIAAAPSHAVTGMAGSLAVREREGAITLGALVVIALAAGALALRVARRTRSARLRLPRHAGWIATALVAVGLALAIVVGANETSGVSSQLGGGATRLATLQSNRYDYWSVALRAFATSPLKGVGAGGWSVYWLRWRTVSEAAQDTHSLELQTLAELGVIGVALLASALAGVALAARRALTVTPAAAGLIAAVVAYLAHSPLDWDWQMPAVTLTAVIAAGSLLAWCRPEQVEGAAVRGDPGGASAQRPARATGPRRSAAPGG
jgi:O-antigen ligase